MAVTGWKYPSGNGAIAGGWISPTNMYADDGSLTNSADIGTGPPNYYQQDYHTFGFTSGDIPVGATILGIEVAFEARSSVSPHTVTVNFQMVKAAAAVGSVDTDTWAYSATAAERVYGGATSLFGVSWLATDFHSSQFGIYYDVSHPNSSSRWRGDYVKIRVYYSTSTHVTKTFSENINFEPTLTKGIGKLLTETINIADSHIKGVQKTLLETDGQYSGIHLVPRGVSLDPETWYCTDDTGGGAGPATRRLLSESEGSAARTVTLNTSYTGVSWNRQLAEQKLGPGSWTMKFWAIAAPIGTSTVTGRICRYNSAGTLQEKLIEATTGTIGSARYTEYTLTQDLSATTWAEGDYMVVEMKYTGVALVLVQYDSPTRDTRIEHPGEIRDAQISVAKSLPEAVNFLDSLTKRIGKTLTEVVDFADTLIKHVSRTFAEALGIKDKLFNKIPKWMVSPPAPQQPHVTFYMMPASDLGPNEFQTPDQSGAAHWSRLNSGDDAPPAIPDDTSEIWTDQTEVKEWFTMTAPPAGVGTVSKLTVRIWQRAKHAAPLFGDMSLAVAVYSDATEIASSAHRPAGHGVWPDEYDLELYTFDGLSLNAADLADVRLYLNLLNDIPGAWQIALRDIRIDLPEIDYTITLPDGRRMDIYDEGRLILIHEEPRTGLAVEEEPRTPAQAEEDRLMDIHYEDRTIEIRRRQ